MDAETTLSMIDVSLSWDCTNANGVRMLNKPLAHRDVSSAHLFSALGHPYMIICSAPPAEVREVAATAS